MYSTLMQRTSPCALSSLKKPPFSSSPKLRVGRGVASGLGKTCGRGQKGQLARGYGARLSFEGGQTTLVRRLPKRGFRSSKKSNSFIINISSLQKFSEDSVIDYNFLITVGLITKQQKSIKILGKGELSKRFCVSAHFFSDSAVRKIKEAGGQIILLQK